MQSIVIKGFIKEDWLYDCDQNKFIKLKKFYDNKVYGYFMVIDGYIIRCVISESVKEWCPNMTYYEECLLKIQASDNLESKP